MVAPDRRRGDHALGTVDVEPAGARRAGDSTTVAVEVVRPAPDVNGNGRAATDPDGDGRCEDVTGDGTVNVVDVAEFPRSL